ncbi:TPA: hypothetical protein I9068_001766 [Clostridium perfringens]|nr:hypothetical protein [Clostridium perfringens]
MKKSLVKKLALIATSTAWGMMLIAPNLVNAKPKENTCSIEEKSEENVSKKLSYKEVMLDAVNTKNINLSDLKEVENNDKENLIKLAKNDKKFNLLIEKLYENNLISEKNYKLDSSSEIKGEDYKLDTVYFSVGEGFISFSNIEGEPVSVAIVQQKDEKGISYMYLYTIEENELKLIDKVIFDKENNTLLKIPKRIKRSFTWPSFAVYGNWCGPGHSGPAAPVDRIDKCCWLHDSCYGSNEPQKDCDERLIKCLQWEYNTTTSYGKKLINVMITAFKAKIKLGL